MDAERLRERGEAIWAFERTGGRTARLVRLDGQVRAATRSDWPDRRPGEVEWRADPALWFPGKGPGVYRKELKCARGGCDLLALAEGEPCGCWDDLPAA
jgi:hypothetical protein